jgi:serine/threonine protein kinase
MSNKFRMLISRMLQVDPASRISAQEAVELINSWTPAPKRASPQSMDSMMFDAGVCMVGV